MHKRNKLLLSGLLALSALPSLSVAKSAESAQACWKPAFEAMDADAVARCYAPDAVLWLPNMPMMQGRDAIREGHAGFFSAFTVKRIDLVELGSIQHGDESAGWGSFTMVIASKSDGKEVTEHGRYTDVSRKIDGKWMYVVDHASDDPAPAPVPTPVSSK